MATRCSDIKFIGHLGERSSGAVLGGHCLMGIDVKEMRKEDLEREIKKTEFFCKEQRIEGIPGGGNKTRESLHLFLLMSEKMRMAYSRCR